MERIINGICITEPKCDVCLKEIKDHESITLVQFQGLKVVHTKCYRASSDIKKDLIDARKNESKHDEREQTPTEDSAGS